MNYGVGPEPIYAAVGDLNGDGNSIFSHVEVCWEGQAIAQHERSYLTRQEALALEHYLEVLEYKPGAFAHSKALTQYRQAGLWPESFERFWEKLMERHGRSQGTRAMIGLLRLAPTYGRQQLQAAIETALLGGSSDAATVSHLLKPEMRAAHTAVPLIGNGSGFERPMPALELYDELLSVRQQMEVRQ